MSLRRCPVGGRNWRRRRRRILQLLNLFDVRVFAPYRSRIAISAIDESGGASNLRIQYRRRKTSLLQDLRRQVILRAALQSGRLFFELELHGPGAIPIDRDPRVRRPKLGGKRSRPCAFEPGMKPAAALDPRLIAVIGACRLCRDAPLGKPLPHEPRPVFQAHPSARLAIFGQAPGARVHASGRPFSDPSGVRLREWLGLDEAAFYDVTKVAIVPMGFCFPGQDVKGGDLPPRKECAPQWRARLLAQLPAIRTAVVLGSYAQAWHLGDKASAGVLETVRRWRDFAPRFFPAPHPSWRNNAWLKKNSWFETDVLPVLRAAVQDALAI